MPTAISACGIPTTRNISSCRARWRRNWCERHDLIEFDQEGEPVKDKRQPYLERFIHAAIFEARPDVTAVVHAHAEDTLPFGLIKTPLQPVIHSGSFIGGKVPVWDIRKKFGDTNLLVTNMAQGRDLAKSLGKGNVALMRGHGFASAARSIIEVVRLSVYLPRNARVQMTAMQAGKPIPLSKGEIAARAAGYQTACAGDLARLGILGESRRLRRHDRRAACARSAPRSASGEELPSFAFSRRFFPSFAFRRIMPKLGRE